MGPATYMSKEPPEKKRQYARLLHWESEAENENQ